MGEGPGLAVVLVSDIAADHRLSARLRAAGFRTVDRIGLPADASAPAIVAALGAAWAVVAGGERYDADVLDQLPHLRVIVRTGSGYDTIDVAAASSRGILVATTPGANAEAVADLALGLMLACLRQIPLADQAVRAGRWRPDVLLSPDLNRRTVGIVGLGRIGRAVANRLAGFECHLLGYDPVPDRAFCEARGITLCSFEDLLRESDVVTLHVPLSLENRALLGPREFAMMRPGAVLINTSRGPLVTKARW
jgi:D-3-phosphoglycerate dehydrogenase